MPTATTIKALAFDPVGRWDAIPDAVIDRIVAAVSRLYVSLEAEAEHADLVAWHTAHLLAVSGAGAVGGGVGPVASHSISLGGASTTYAVAAVPVGAAVDPLDGRTVYGATALALRACIPTVTTGGG